MEYQIKTASEKKELEIREEKIMEEMSKLHSNEKFYYVIAALVIMALSISLLAAIYSTLKTASLQIQDTAASILESGFCNIFFGDRMYLLVVLCDLFLTLVMGLKIEQKNHYNLQKEKERQDNQSDLNEAAQIITEQKPARKKVVAREMSEVKRDEAENLYEAFYDIEVIHQALVEVQREIEESI